MKFDNDPVGYAIHDFDKDLSNANIIVKSDLCEDDVLPVPYLFRDFNEMPEIEQFALMSCEGRVLDIGAGAGCHSFFLQNSGQEVLAIDRSAGAVKFLKSRGINALHIDFMKFSGEKFDTILLLMNGIGLAGSLEKLPQVLNHLKGLLNENGTIFCDSTDINYMFTNDDGSVWMDLNSNYYGEMNFNMQYKGVESGWFPWLYIDPQKLTDYGNKAGMDVEVVLEGDNNHYLAELKIK